MLKHKVWIRLAIAILTLGLSALFGSGSARAGNNDLLYIQVSSHDVLPEAVERARQYAGQFSNSAVFESTNGKFAVVVGTTTRRDAKLLLSSLKLEKRVPQDTLLTTGRRYAKPVWSMTANPAGPERSAVRVKSGGMVFLSGFDARALGAARQPPSTASRPVDPSLAARCSMISLLTAANGGYSTDPAREDPDFILLEQFCLARLFAITASGHLARSQWGAIENRIVETCNAFGAAMKGVLAELHRADKRAIVGKALTLAKTSVSARADLIGTGRVCLGLGYKSDNDQTALAAAVLLYALGEKPYGEYVGHHLLQGVGVAPNPALAASWLAGEGQSPDILQTATFANSAAERASLISAALTRLSDAAAH